MAIKDYSTTAGNNAAINGVNIAEGCPPGNLNDAIREVMADVRSLVGVSDGIGWIDLGLTPTYVSASSFRVAGNATGVFSVGRRLRIDGSLYGKITARVYSGGVTTVTVALDSGSISSGISAVAVGIPATGKPIDVSAISGLANSATITAAVAETADTLVMRDSTGNVKGKHVLADSHLSMAHTQVSRNTDTVFYSSINNYLYKNTAAGFRTSLDVHSKGEAASLFVSQSATLPADLNTITTTGYYSTSSSTLNRPSGNTVHGVYHLDGGSTRYQLSVDGGDLYWRRYLSGSWADWSKAAKATELADYASLTSTAAQTFAAPVHTVGNCANYLSGTSNTINFGYTDGTDRGTVILAYGKGHGYAGRVLIGGHAGGSYVTGLTLRENGDVHAGWNAVTVGSKLIRQTDLDAVAWPGVYSGTSAANLTFPVGSIVAGVTDSTPRNSTSTVRLHPAYDWIYTAAGTGDALTGTWRHRGAGGSGVTSIWQRVA